MAKPGILERLAKGWLLSGKNFPGFADTFNYAIDRIENLKGDFDTNPKDGHITVDNADPEHPVIRLAKIPEGGSGTGSVMPGCFDLDSNYEFINCYYRVEQFVFEILAPGGIASSGLYYLNINTDSPSSAYVASTNSVTDFNIIASSLSVCVIPLYYAFTKSDGSISEVVDLRNIPSAPTWSVYGGALG